MNKMTKIFWIDEDGKETYTYPTKLKRERPTLYENMDMIQQVLRVYGDVILTIRPIEYVPSGTKYGVLRYDFREELPQAYEVFYSCKKHAGMYVVLDNADGEPEITEDIIYRPTKEEVLRHPGRRILGKIIKPMVHSD